MKKVLFIDRDGTIILEPPHDYQVDKLDKFRFYPGCITWLSRIYHELDYIFVLVTNQDGLGTASFPETEFWPYQELMLHILEGEGIKFTDIFIDRSFPEQNSPYRKPGTKMLEKYLTGQYDLGNSYVIGDRWTDIQLAQNIGAKGIFINRHENELSQNPDFKDDTALITAQWKDLYTYLKHQHRKNKLIRHTKETKIQVELDLDGIGYSDIKTKIDFFDHMLDQISKHGQLDLFVRCNGDIHVDEHHTIEDVGLALGQCFREALGKKIGIDRYGFSLPMDDCKAQVSIDFGGRPWLNWKAEFLREKIGEMPTEMFYHFFKSFSDAAQCNLDIEATGQNEHHKIEAIFKAFAKAIKLAKNINLNSAELPSTKGTL